MRRACFLASAAALALITSCGSRSDLAVQGTTAAVGGAGSGGATAGSGGGAVDAGTDAPPPPDPCLLVSGAAVDILAFPDRHATAPSAAAFGPSDIALQTFASGGSSAVHDDIQIARFSIGESWPGGLAMSAAPQLFGIESHGWANLVVAPNEAGLALTWHGDPGGKGRPMFRLWDVASWSPQAPVDIDAHGEAVLDTAPGAGVGAFGVGYGGDGYGVVWRDVLPGGGTASTAPLLAVLDAAGQRVLGPHAVAGHTDYPGRSPSIVWSGAAYLLATSFITCPPGDMLCAPLSVVISRVRPASGDLVDDSGIDLAAVLPAQTGTMSVGRASLSHHAGRTYVGWSEGDQGELGSPRRIFLAELSATGEVVAGPVLIDETAPMRSRMTLRASELGVSATWAEDDDPSFADNAIGRSRVVTTHLDADLAMLSKRVTVAATRWDSYGAPMAVALTQPKSLFVVWSGRAEAGPGFEDVWATRLDCAK